MRANPQVRFRGTPVVNQTHAVRRRLFRSPSGKPRARKASLNPLTLPKRARGGQSRRLQPARPGSPHHKTLLPQRSRSPMSFAARLRSSHLVLPEHHRSLDALASVILRPHVAATTSDANRKMNNIHRPIAISLVAVPTMSLANPPKDAGKSSCADGCGTCCDGCCEGGSSCCGGGCCQV